MANNRVFIFIAVLLLLCQSVGVTAQAPVVPSVPEPLESSIRQIQAERILRNIKMLASDDFEGRAPGTRGEQLTTEYIAEQFKDAGALPGNPNGTFFQTVPMIGCKTVPRISLTVKGKPVPLKFMEDFVHDLPRLQPNVSVDLRDVVFAGYGIVSPQFGWDDYKNANVRGKLVIVLSGEPTRPDPKHDNRSDAAFFRGDTRTYFSTREAKYAEAAKRGAAAILVITDPDKSETFSIFQTFARMEGMALRGSTSTYQPAIVGLITKTAVERLVAISEHPATDLERSAEARAFTPISLNAKGSIVVTSQIRHFSSKNVVARVEGSDSILRNEYVTYSAHWDHLGKDTTLPGDQIYNGASDNAAGTAQLLDIARGFAASKPRPKRSILFIAVTGEEKGFLGSRFYAQNPLYPIAKTVAAINLDAGNPFGVTRDLGSAGYGNSTVDAALAAAAAMQGRTFVEESIDGNGSYYFASDQIEFAKVGIPAVFPWSGFEYVGKPADFGEKKWDEFGKKRYHQVGDEVMPDWDMSGAAEDARWLLIAGYLIAEDVKRPTWLPGTEFKR